MENEQEDKSNPDNERSQFVKRLGQETDIKNGLFIAVVSENDSSTPFWIAQIIAEPEGNTGGSKQIGVRWYQASGTSSDPYDAAYIPSVRKRNCNTGNVTYWESSIPSSKVIFVFQALTNEGRIGSESAREIRSLLYT